MHIEMSEDFQHVLLQCVVAIAMAMGIGILVSFSVANGRRRKGLIPGRLGFPFIGETFSFLGATNSTKGCYDFVRQRRQRYGEWFKTRIFGKIHVFLPSLEAAKTVFANDFVLFNKGYVKSMGDAVGKKSLLCVPQETHGRIRRLLSDPFSMNSLAKFVQKFDSMLSGRLWKLENSGKSFRVLKFSMKVAFDAMCDMLMSVTDASLLEELERDVTAISDAMISFPIMIPGTRYYRGMKARTRLMKKLMAMITRRRNERESLDDFLQSMLDRDSYPPNEKLSDEEILDNLLTLIVAGQSTTASAIMWCVKFLDENKQVQDRLRAHLILENMHLATTSAKEEQLSIMRNKPKGALLTHEDLKNMSYGAKVVKETLRMSNVLLWYPRVALDDCTIEGFEIKKGWHVNVDATHIHYNPAIYKDPLSFNPSRFDEFQKPYSYIPFGSGPRTCLGINMAKLTMLVFISRLTSGYTWTVDDQDLSLEKKAHIPRLRSGCPITLKSLNGENM